MMDATPPGPTVPTATPESRLQKVRRRAGWAIRDRVPHRWVTRDVFGVSMAMPWSHRLPDYARLDPAYAQNLVNLAVGLGVDGPISLMDVGANIGDSAMLIMDKVETKVLAVEPDEVFLPFLRHNLGSDPAVSIEPSMLLAGDGEEHGDLVTVRIGGTAMFAQGDGDGQSAAIPSITVDELRARHPEFDDLRLVKSDTDGFDVTLVPAIARTWADTHPVLFFEYDHRVSRMAGADPLKVWDDLAALGYSECAVWDNGGHPIARLSIAETAELARRTDPSGPSTFWDVAAVHVDDAVAIGVIDRLVPR